MIKKFDSKAFLRQLTQCPGVYRMLDQKDYILYIGKAKNLKKRVSSYFQQAQNSRIQQMVADIAHIEIITTQSEAEALILENNLIKKHRPKYNILLKDSKGYPYIYISDDIYPRISLHRGKKKSKGCYFGPYPNTHSVKETLVLLQKTFLIRQCENSVFQHRSRPCLQYQIKRCSAPCVDLIERQAYQQDIEHARYFLEGKNIELKATLMEKMDQAAIQLNFEQAAKYRDQIRDLQRIQEKQYISTEKGDVDIIACALENGLSCIQLFYIRAGRNLGNKVYYPKNSAMTTPEHIISAFISRHYLGAQAVKELLVSHQPEDKQLLETVLSKQWGQACQIKHQVRSTRAKWLEMAKNNAQLALKAYSSSKINTFNATQTLQSLFSLKNPIKRMECYDISHTSGECTVASCVVFNAYGALKSDYRRFNIEGITGGDDYAAMRQVLTRRYQRILKEKNKRPDIIFIDGGKGQLAAAADILKTFKMSHICLVGIAKGENRKAGLEKLFLLEHPTPIILPSDSPTLRIIQQIRDEAHRFAITGHRARRAKSRKTSILESIAGVGVKRRQNCLRHFGGLEALKSAGIDEIARVEGISKAIAIKIYTAFHGEN